LVATTDLIATLPAGMLRALGYPVDIQPVPVPIPEIPLLVMWHPRDTHDPKLRWLRGEIEASVDVSAEVRRKASARARSSDEMRSSHTRRAARG
jgi:DNA-binding transcriptional LysR family regulator